MVRRSTVAVSTLVPALKVLSTVLLDSTFLSFVRTKAGPLPGFTCWNSTTAQSWPSMLRTMPFFRSFVVAMRACQPSYVEWVRGVTHPVGTSGGVYRARPPPAEPPAPSAHGYSSDHTIRTVTDASSRPARIGTAAPWSRLERKASSCSTGDGSG